MLNFMSPEAECIDTYIFKKPKLKHHKIKWVLRILIDIEKVNTSKMFCDFFSINPLAYFGILYIYPHCYVIFVEFGGMHLMDNL